MKIVRWAFLLGAMGVCSQTAFSDDASASAGLFGAIFPPGNTAQTAADPETAAEPISILDAAGGPIGSSPGYALAVSAEGTSTATDIASSGERTGGHAYAAERADDRLAEVRRVLAKTCACDGDFAEIRPVLLAALSDRDEDVRRETASAIAQRINSPCESCGRICCDEVVAERLRQMATARDDQGRWQETSFHVRIAASVAADAWRRAALSAPAVRREQIAGHVDPANRNVLVSSRSEADGGTLAEGNEGNAFFPERNFEIADGELRFSAYQPAAPPLQPARPPAAAPPQPARPPATAIASSSFGDWARQQEREELLDFAPLLGESAGKSEATTQATTNLTGLLEQSSTVQSVKARRRSAAAFEPYVRGFQAGQVYAVSDGAYWTSARRDLDPMLSKIDPGMIENVEVISGPYGLRYGPGFAFIDVQRAPTPRYEGGHQAHFDLSGDVRTNGGATYGRSTVYGGSSNWGYRFSYGDRKASDYEAGNGLRIPSSYHNQDVWGELSYDLAEYQTIEFSYLRLDQVDTEYAAQFFDINNLGTDGFSARITDEDPEAPWTRLRISGWYNRTRFAGDNANKAARADFPVMQRVNEALDLQFGDPLGTNQLFANTYGGLATSGVRASAVFGDLEAAHVNLGADFRYLSQYIDERYDLEPQDLVWATNQPHTWMSDPGAFVEFSLPMTEAWKASIGARYDYAATSARAADLNTELVDSALPGGDALLEQEDSLYAFYLMNEYAINPCWTLLAGFGHAQRPPTLTERYANGLFISYLQSGFTRVIGDPRLDPERDWHVDLGITAEHERWRGRATAFHSWVLDYVSVYDDQVGFFTGNDEISFPDARLLRYYNVDLAALYGFETYGEFDVAPRLSVFGKMSYVEGRNQEIDAPLPNIPPLEGTVGVRIHDTDGGRRWGVELGSRIVDNQDRLGTIPLRGGAPVVVEQPTAGFTVWHLRAYYNRTEKLSLIAGIDNLFDRTYLEHLDLRLIGPSVNGVPLYDPTYVYSPGFTPYCGLRWIY